MISLGCPKNLVDSEIMLGLLDNNGFEITNDESEANIIIVNTCGFIESAKQESINTILEMAQYKNKNCELLIAAGCLAERYHDEIMEQIPEVDAVVGTGGCGGIAEVIKRAYAEDKREVQFLGGSNDISYLESGRIISSGCGYAYLKIAEGCDNCCTYCAIPGIKGRFRSRKMESIVREAEDIAKRAIKEVILVAQDTTRYGADIYGAPKLHELIGKVSLVKGIDWIRLLYCYPELISDRLIEEIKNNEKVCKYIDIPIQHISDRILKLMGRRGSSDEIKRVLYKLRESIPQIAIRTSLIVGFPGENDEDFRLLLNFVEEFKFEMLGVFTYSKEEGTPAAKMKGHIPARIKKERYSEIMELQKGIVREKNAGRLNKCYRTLVEGISEDGIFYYGRTYAEAPEIDGKVYFTSQFPLRTGDFADVRILDHQDYDLIGEVINESAQ